VYVLNNASKLNVNTKEVIIMEKTRSFIKKNITGMIGKFKQFSVENTKRVNADEEFCVFRYHVCISNAHVSFNKKT